MADVLPRRLPLRARLSGARDARLVGTAAGPGRRPASPVAGADWPTYHGGPALDGAVDGAAPEAPEPLWRVEAGAPVRAVPVAGGGRIYALTERGDLVAVSPAGRVLWRARLDEPAAAGGGQGAAFTAPPLYLAGTVVVGSLGGTVHALDAATGRARWKALVGGSVQGSPTFAPPARGRARRGPRALAGGREDRAPRPGDGPRAGRLPADEPLRRLGRGRRRHARLRQLRRGAALASRRQTLRPLGRVDAGAATARSPRGSRSPPASCTRGTAAGGSPPSTSRRAEAALGEPRRRRRDLLDPRGARRPGGLLLGRRRRLRRWRRGSGRLALAARRGRAPRLRRCSPPAGRSPSRRGGILLVLDARQRRAALVARGQRRDHRPRARRGVPARRDRRRRARRLRRATRGGAP